MRPYRLGFSRHDDAGRDTQYGIPNRWGVILDYAGKWMGGLQSYVYWSGTEFAPNTNNAWNFNTNNGNQNINNKDNNNLYAWAVRSGE